jgi:hypothetical protein
LVFFCIDTLYKSEPHFYPLKTQKTVIFPMGPVYGGGLLCINLPRLQGFVFVIRQHENEDDCGALVE